MENVLNDLYTKYLHKYIDKEKMLEASNMFIEHINTHKYWLNEDYTNEISLSEAYNDWLEYIFEPFIYIVEKYKVLKYINYDIIKLYENIMRMWHDMNQNYKEVYINHVINEYCLSLRDYPYLKKLRIKLSNKKPVR